MMPAQPAGDPQAARRLAAAYRDAADALARTELTGTWTRGTLGGLWSGPARDAADVPLDALARQARTLAAGLTETADQLETYARRLEDAQHDHGAHGDTYDDAQRDQLGDGHGVVGLRVLQSPGVGLQLVGCLGQARG